MDYGSGASIRIHSSIAFRIGLKQADVRLVGVFQVKNLNTSGRGRLQESSPTHIGAE
jgi:hypothetical protein